MQLLQHRSFNIKQPLRVLIFILASTFISQRSSAQTGKTILHLEEAQQACLDSGVYMLGCSRKFYFQMDSLLNVVYINLRSNLDSSKKARLKKEQRSWLVKRDAHFKKTLAEFKRKNPGRSEETAQDDAMFMYESNAEFVKGRVLTLIGWLQLSFHQ